LQITLDIAVHVYWLSNSAS